jgi:hypothetical protein
LPLYFLNVHVLRKDVRLHMGERRMGALLHMGELHMDERHKGEQRGMGSWLHTGAQHRKDALHMGEQHKDVQRNHDLNTFHRGELSKELQLHDVLP